MSKRSIIIALAVVAVTLVIVVIYVILRGASPNAEIGPPAGDPPVDGPSSTPPDTDTEFAERYLRRLEERLSQSDLPLTDAARNLLEHSIEATLAKTPNRTSGMPKSHEPAIMAIRAAYRDQHGDSPGVIDDQTLRGILDLICPFWPLCD